MKKVVVTGMGIVCGNANNKSEFIKACSEGISGIKKCTAFSTDGLLTEYFGEADIDERDTDARLRILIKKSCAEMLSDCGLDRETLSSEGKNCRLFYGTLLSNTGSYYKHSINKADGKPSDGTLAGMNDYISYIKELTGVKGGASVSSAACASGTTAAGMALDYIRNGICDMAVVGGADPLTIVAAYGFNALKSLSSGTCNPYDEKRDGINIGECGAFLMFESIEHALKRNANIYCEIAGYSIGNDAYHITSPEPDGSGAYRTMLSALSDGSTDIDEVDYINGHGTGTAINDSMEIKAINRIYKGSAKKPALSSTKALIGHCMGASGAAELISVILSMKYNKAIIMPNLTEPVMGADNVYIILKNRDMDINCAISDSFAFAGNSASVLVKKYSGGEA